MASRKANSISVKLLEEHSRGDINPFGIFDMLLKQLDMPTARYVCYANVINFISCRAANMLKREKITE